MKVLSLFDGISCGMVALNRVGCNVELYDAYEIDENAIKISEHNYPNINHKGDVFEAVYTPGIYDLLIGGSPCTYWSIAQNIDKREVTPSGFGWELFKQYYRAVNEAQPKYFLYENNFSISKEIQGCITNMLGVRPIMINSNLVSAQNRKRLYWTNIPNVSQPKDKHIMFYDLFNLPYPFIEDRFRPVGKWVYSKWGDKLKIDMLGHISDEKAHTLTTSKTHSWMYYLNDNNTKYTNLTVNEWEQLQTLPIGYCDNVPIKETAKYKAIGNGWTVDVIAHILQGIREN